MGYAVARDGRGVAYARVADGLAPETLRIPFALSRGWRHAAKDDVAGYAAMVAVARAVRRRGGRRVRFVLSDERFANEVTTRSAVAQHLALPYIRLRCELNAFSKCEIRTAPTEDLTHRARAEAALNLAA